jgi:hypothetical protein
LYLSNLGDEKNYYVLRSKNEVLCAAAGRLAAERSEADKPAKADALNGDNNFICRSSAR